MLSQKESDWIKRLEKAVDINWDDLTEWEKSFIEDVLERFRCWGEKIKISKKQWEILTRISDKII